MSVWILIVALTVVIATFGLFIFIGSRYHLFQAQLHILSARDNVPNVWRHQPCA